MKINTGGQISQRDKISAIELYNLNHVASILQKDRNSERINKGFVDCPRLSESYGNF